MAQGRGSGKTPVRVVELLQNAVKETSQSALARAIGVPLHTVQRCLMGVGEPTQATLEKLAKYFEKPVWWFREEIIFDNIEREKASTRFWEAVENILRRGKISIEDRHDLGTIEMEFAVIMEDARMFEKILLREESNRETLVSKRMTKEWKEFSKEIDVISKDFMSEEPTKKTE